MEYLMFVLSSTVHTLVCSCEFNVCVCVSQCVEGVCVLYVFGRQLKFQRPLDENNSKFENAK